MISFSLGFDQCNDRKSGGGGGGGDNKRSRSGPVLNARKDKPRNRPR